MLVRIKYKDGRTITLFDVMAVLHEGGNTIVIIYKLDGNVNSAVVNANECDIEIV